MVEKKATGSADKEAVLRPVNEVDTTPPGHDAVNVAAEAGVKVPDESPSASIKVRTVFPHGSFIVEGVPEITPEGTMLTKDQYKKVSSLAPEYGLRLETDEEAN